MTETHPSWSPDRYLDLAEIIYQRGKERYWSAPEENRVWFHRADCKRWVRDLLFSEPRSYAARAIALRVRYLREHPGYTGEAFTTLANASDRTAGELTVFARLFHQESAKAAPPSPILVPSV